LHWSVRSVITTDELNWTVGLARWRILQPQGATVVRWCASCQQQQQLQQCRTMCNSTVLAAGQVAGFDTAAFTATPAELTPLLFRWQLAGESDAGGSGGGGGGSGDLPPPALIAATMLSNFQTARFGPTDAWSSLWEFILGELHDPSVRRMDSALTVAAKQQARHQTSQSNNNSNIRTKRNRSGVAASVPATASPLLPPVVPPVRPAYRLNATLPSNAARVAIIRSATWLANTSGP
jgi:hypothetical protein